MWVKPLHTSPVDPEAAYVSHGLDLFRDNTMFTDNIGLGTRRLDCRDLGV
jgi:hypothetical protein